MIYDSIWTKLGSNTTPPHVDRLGRRQGGPPGNGICPKRSKPDRTMDTILNRGQKCPQ